MYEATGAAPAASGPSGSAIIVHELVRRSAASYLGEPDAPELVLDDQGSLLLVEDDEVLLCFLAEVFRAQGYRVLTAGTGEMALRLARRHQPEVVLLDIGLPGRNGLQVLRSMRRCDKLAATLILLLTGRQIVTDLYDAYNLGADDYLVKPVRSDELVARVRELLRTRH